MGRKSLYLEQSYQIEVIQGSEEQATVGSEIIYDIGREIFVKEFEIKGKRTQPDPVKRFSDSRIDNDLESRFESTHNALGSAPVLHQYLTGSAESEHKSHTTEINKEEASDQRPYVDEFTVECSTTGIGWDPLSLHCYTKADGENNGKRFHLGETCRYLKFKLLSAENEAGGGKTASTTTSTTTTTTTAQPLNFELSYVIGKEVTY
eukprot:GEZU01016878.1.p1 GENE.GEZU01016878.1~~GEZU01016878.1.p1  ORF type:complete len:206 (+),score=46.47 GEZU01016878.1:190-807(+)